MVHAPLFGGHELVVPSSQFHTAVKVSNLPGSVKLALNEIVEFIGCGPLGVAVIGPTVGATLVTVSVLVPLLAA